MWYSIAVRIAYLVQEIEFWYMCTLGVSIVARPFIFPDPRDRSINEPTLVVSQTQVIGNFNQANAADKREKVTDPVKEWFKGEALKAGWKNVEFHGSQCVLTAEIVMKK
jgi:hypothetical protein